MKTDLARGEAVVQFANTHFVGAFGKKPPFLGEGRQYEFTTPLWFLSDELGNL